LRQADAFALVLDAIDQSELEILTAPLWMNGSGFSGGERDAGDDLSVRAHVCNHLVGLAYGELVIQGWDEGS
jgi:hypothetical protein